MADPFQGVGLYQAFDQRRDFLRNRNIADAERIRDHAIQNAQLSMQKTQFQTSQDQAALAMRGERQRQVLEAAQGERAGKEFATSQAAAAQQHELTDAQLSAIRHQSASEGQGDMIFNLSSSLNSHYAGMTPQQISAMTRDQRVQKDTLSPAEIKSAIDQYNGNGNVAIDPKSFHYDPATHAVSFVFAPKNNPSARQFYSNTLEGMQMNMYAMAHMGDKPIDLAPGHIAWTPMGGTVAKNSVGYDGTGLGSVWANPDKYNGVEWSSAAAGVVANALGGKFANGSWNIDPANEEKWKVANDMIGQMEQKYGPNLDPHAAGAMVLDALSKGYQSDSDIQQRAQAESNVVYHPSFTSRVGDWLQGNSGQNPVVHGIDTRNVSQDDYVKQRTDQLNGTAQQNVQDVLNNNILGYFKQQNGVSPSAAPGGPASPRAPFGGAPPAADSNAPYPNSVQPQPGQDQQPGLSDATPPSS